MNVLQTTVAAILLLIAAPALATTGLHLSFEELCRGADAIVRGTVTDVESFESDGRILTRTVVHVDETFKGSVATEVTVVQLGGRVGDRVSRVAGIPTFVANESAILFLEKPPQGEHFVIYGMDQGKMEIMAGNVIPPITQMRLLDAAGHEVQPQIGTPMSLDAFRASVTAIVGRR